MQAVAFPELMPELLPVSERTRRHLPRWDPRLWGDHEVLQAGEAHRPRSPASFRDRALVWARAHVQTRRANQSHAVTPRARDEATPPCRAQHGPAVEQRASPARASTALGGVGGPQAATPQGTSITPQSSAAEDRRRWASPAYLSANGMRLARLHYEPPAKGEPQLTTPNALHASNLHLFLNLPDHLGSSSLTIDHATGELVEARTYQPYGATESDYRPERWKGFREDYGLPARRKTSRLG